MAGAVSCVCRGKRRNGSGKSTTFKALLGLIHPDGGEIEVFGKKAEELKPEDKQKLGVVFADSGFSMYLTAAGVANIMKSIYPDFDREKFLQQCRRFNLPTDKKIAEYAGHEYRRGKAAAGRDLQGTFKGL